MPQRSLDARARRTLPFLLSLLLSLTAFAQAPKPAPAARTHPAAPATSSLPAAKPEDVGVSSERLERIDRTVQQYVNEGKVSGVVTLVARKGQVVQFGAYGKRDIESGSPMAKDSIFRIASMSKAITSVAIMMLMEDGKLAISDPVSKFIPQFKNTTVAVEYRDAHVDAPGRGERAREARDHHPRSADAHQRRVCTARAWPKISTRPRTSTAGTSRTRTSRSARSSNGSRHFRSTRSRARVISTASTPTSSAWSSNARQASASTSSSARASSRR